MSSPWWDLLRDYTLTRGETLKAISYLSYARHLGWRNPTQPPYHPMRDGLVEQMNCFLLSLLRTLTERQSDSEDHLQLLLFAYRTSQHSTTKLSPYEVLFGWNPPSLQLPSPSTSTSPDPGDYSCQLQ